MTADGKPRPLRYVLDDAIEASALPHRQRHILHTLLRRAEVDLFNARIPDQFQPSVIGLQKRSGIRHQTLLSDLNQLERTGWLIRKRSRGGRGRRTQYTVTMPETGPLPDPIQASESGPLADPFSAGNRSAFEGGNRSATGPQLNQRTKSSVSGRGELSVIRRFLPDATDEEIAEIQDQQDLQHVQNHSGWWTTLGENGDLKRLLDELRVSRRQAARKRFRAELDTMPVCEDNVPGGDVPDPETGLPWACPMCRARAANRQEVERDPR